MDLRYWIHDLLEVRSPAATPASAEEQLSPHFTVSELTRSVRARANGIDNQPGARELAALRNLCGTILEPVREHFGPVTVSSGYRSIAVNKLVGGSSTSQHMIGEAADITVRKATVTALFQWIVLESNLPFDQVIWEFGRWVHVSAIAHGPPRRESLVARKVGGKTRYERVSAPQVKSMK